MEFDALTEFFSSLKYAKRRYPMIVTYTNRHLNKISSDTDKAEEVEHFKRFLVANQNPGLDMRALMSLMSSRSPMVLTC